MLGRSVVENIIPNERRYLMNIFKKYFYQYFLASFDADSNILERIT